VEKTKKICVACFKSIPAGATTCPLCETEQPGPGQEKYAQRRIQRVQRLRWIYGCVIVAVVAFLAVQLWDNRGKKVSPEQQCATAKSYGFGGTMQDCIAQMSK
jgi:hypothetical protein